MCKTEPRASFSACTAGCARIVDPARMAHVTDLELATLLTQNAKTDSCPCASAEPLLDAGYPECSPS